MHPDEESTAPEIEMIKPENRRAVEMIVNTHMLSFHCHTEKNVVLPELSFSEA